MANEQKLREYLKRVTADLHQTRQRLQDAESASREPIAIVGMGCRFPGGVARPGGPVAAGRRRRRRDHRLPGRPRLGPRTSTTPTRTSPAPATRARAASCTTPATFDAGLLRHLPARGPRHGPAAAAAAGDRLGGVRAGGHRPAVAARQPHRRVRRRHVPRLRHPRPQQPRGRRGLPRHRQRGQRRLRPGRLHLRPRRPRGHRRHRVLVLAGRPAPGRAGAAPAASAPWRSPAASTVMSTPGTFVEFSRQRGLAADGRCKAFADAADGTGWGEGVGMLLLERLSDARRNGHQVLAVVRGSAVNQDGAQQRPHRAQRPVPAARHPRRRWRAPACRRATSTPSRRTAPAPRSATRSRPRRCSPRTARTAPADRPLWLGSVKSNIGHTQAAAGVAGRHQDGAWRCGTACCRARCTSTRRRSHVDWSAGAVELLTEAAAVAGGRAGPRRAGVSSFGISGTNAHVIVEQAPRGGAGRRWRDGAGRSAVLPWLVSGRTAAALRAQAGAAAGAALARRRRCDPVDVASVAGDAAPALRAPGGGRRRGTADELAARRWRPLAAGAAAARCRDGAPGAGRRSCSPGRVRSGWGWAGSLYDAFPVFAEAFDAVCARLDRRAGLAADGRAVRCGRGLLDRTECAQPALFAVEVALFRLVESWGVRPGRRGRVTRSVSSPPRMWPGCCRWRTRARLVAARGRLMQALPAGGAMVAVAGGGGRGRGRCWTAGRTGVGVAAVNGPPRWWSPVTRTAVDGLGGDVSAAQGRRTRRLRVVARVPLAADGADAATSSARSRASSTYQRATAAGRLQRHRRAGRGGRARGRRVLGPARAARRSASPTACEPWPAGRVDASSSSAPTPSLTADGARHPRRRRQREAGSSPSAAQGPPGGRRVADRRSPGCTYAASSVDWTPPVRPGTEPAPRRPAHLRLPAPALLARRRSTGAAPTARTARTPWTTEFWEAVEREDLAALTGDARHRRRHRRARPCCPPCRLAAAAARAVDTRRLAVPDRLEARRPGAATTCDTRHLAGRAPAGTEAGRGPTPP